MQTPTVRDLRHLRHIVRVEMERARQEGHSTLYLDGCTAPADRRLVDDQVRAVETEDAACRLLSAVPTPRGYILGFCRRDAAHRDWEGDDIIIAQGFQPIPYDA